MTLDQFSQYLTWGIYIVIFCVAAVKLVRRPTQANIDIAIFFAMPAIVIGITLLESLGVIPKGVLLDDITASAIIAMGYMMLRLVDDFSVVPAWLMRTALSAFVVCMGLLFFVLPPRPLLLNTLEVAYLVWLLIYTTGAFLRESLRSSGVTKRRLRAVALGSISLIVLFVLSGLLQFVPWLLVLSRPLSDFAGLTSSVFYFLGFATPNILRRAWQEPELRAFLGRAASLPNLPDTDAILAELERGAALSVGAPRARIGLWDDTLQRLRFKTAEGYYDLDMESSVTGRAFARQEALFSDNSQRDSPAHAAATRPFGAVAVLVAPITAGEKRVGVLAGICSPRPHFRGRRPGPGAATGRSGCRYSGEPGAY